MQATVIAALRALLMEEGRVCLPGIGTLLVVRQPALVSPIEGVASAPSGRVSFNENLVVDDGRLLREVDRPQLEEFLAQTTQSLDAGRTVVLEGIGKLYRQPDGEIRFTASGENFRKESFGLPAVALRPIVRKEKKVAATKTEVLTKPVRKLRESPAGARYGNVAWYVAAGAGTLLLIFLLFRLAGTLSTELDPAETVNAPRERLNVPPPADAPTPEEVVVEAGSIRPEAPPRLNQPPAPATEAAPAPAARNVAVIAIGLYGRQRNVDKQTRRLSEAGYTPYTDKEGRNTRVGVQVGYDSEEELRRVLQEVRARYTEQAYVMRVNGEERRPQ